MKMDFETSLRIGDEGENIATRLYRSRGKCVQRIFPDPRSSCGTRLLLSTGTLVAPDMLVFPDWLWIDVKLKTAWTWHRNSRAWQDGIDKRYRDHYLDVQHYTHFAVHLNFLHLSDIASESDIKAGSPPNCPTGLYACPVDQMPDHVSSEEQPNGSKAEMLYWSVSRLRRIATLEEIAALQS